MVKVAHLIPDVEEIFGVSARNGASTRERIYRHIQDAVETLSNSGDWDPNLVWLDICCPATRCTALPGWVETVFAVSADGLPTQGRDRWYEVHLNGPGMVDRGMQRDWIDAGRYPTLQDVTTPKVLVAHIELPADAGVQVRVYGWDENNVRLKTEEADGRFTDGYTLPAVAGYAMPPAQTVKPARIEAIVKGVTQGRVRVATLDWQSDGSSGALLADLEGPDEYASYPRIKVGFRAQWLRLMVRRKAVQVSWDQHWIPLSPRIAIVEMLRSLRKRQTGELAEALQHEADARRFLAERERRIVPPNTGQPQVSMEGTLSAGVDDLSL